MRMALSIIMISGIQIKDHDNLWVLIYVCSFMTVDFIYEFVCKGRSPRARAGGQGARPPEISASKHHKHHNKHHSPAAAAPASDDAPAPDDHKHEA